MAFGQLFLLQLIAHILTDFYFQTGKSTKEKFEKGVKSKYLYWHIIITFALSWALSFQVNFVYISAIIAFTHFFIDLAKKPITTLKPIGAYAFFIDQLLHIIIIAIAVDWFTRNEILDPVFEFNPKAIHLVLIYLIALKPTNILIREVFRAYSIKTPETKDLPNAGKLIGNLERVLIITLSLAGLLEAVGFLIAAKSILRYKDTDNLKTEYVLIGTLLSFGTATLLSLWYLST